MPPFPGRSGPDTSAPLPTLAGRAALCCQGNRIRLSWPRMERRRFPRNVAALARIHEWTAEFLAAHGFPAEAAFDVDLLIEELFTNMVKYHRDATEEIEIGLAAAGPEVTIVVRDFGVDAFDVTQAPEVDPGMPMEERRRGGLGLHFVRQLADTIRYDYADRNSTVTVTKRLET
jgi:serine/threonine-protein kinase RsbW